MNAADRARIGAEPAAHVMVRTARGEARGEGRDGMAAVMLVIMNRADHPKWWGHDPVEVMLQPWQFSCWNDGDPNLPVILSFDPADPEYSDLLELANATLNHQLYDFTGGATGYYDRSMISPPSWVADATFTMELGHHRFYRLDTLGEAVAPDMRNVSAPPRQLAPPPPAEETADQLNAEELERIARDSPAGGPL